MRDFNNNGGINVKGDFNVTDNSHNEHKLLIHCSNEELLRERPFRQENIKIEQGRKVKRLKPFYAVALILLLAAAAWGAWEGKTNLVSILLGAGSFLIGFQSIRATFEPNPFQIEERNAVNEINKILKQRRAE
ncbi:hypothetical protein [Gilvimarinus xylanilyticus]|uniref:Uncharacterized protein n=1 Tax=Gilvimarinus xylanilyticus TaxID=2944139 RepID=A0A9X2KX22_9GAMM|nr:hypothetical protein [Gilvimarinus xylanilyticus]MCP8900375.1 hypothetical protein [Gilvimarinus xylanilyticus]